MIKNIVVVELPQLKKRKNIRKKQVQKKIHASKNDAFELKKIIIMVKWNKY